MMRARLISGLPADLVGSLTGLTQGHFRTPARATPTTRGAELRGLKEGAPRPQRREDRQLDDHRRSINIYARRGAP
jgi:hypothetical protein